MAQSDIIVPDGFRLHTENSSSILLPNNNEAFLNPVQEFNRDLSVACIHTWGALSNEEKKRKWELKQARKAEGGPKNKKQKSVSGQSFVVMQCIKLVFLIDLQSLSPLLLLENHLILSKSHRPHCKKT